MCRPRRAVLGLLVCVLASGARAEVYRWTDAAGREHYAGELAKVPAEHRAAAAAAAAEPAPSRLQTFDAPARPAALPGRASARGVLHVPYEQHGNAMLVYARL